MLFSNFDENFLYNSCELGSISKNKNKSLDFSLLESFPNCILLITEQMVIIQHVNGWVIRE